MEITGDQHERKRVGEERETLHGTNESEREEKERRRSRVNKSGRAANTNQQPLFSVKGPHRPRRRV
jgi:hypothetical protein